jgi:hypothetical protein
MGQFGFHPEEVDEAFGVAQVHPQTATYIIRVDANARTRLPCRPGTAYFSDPPVQTLGFKGE